MGRFSIGRAVPKPEAEVEDGAPAPAPPPPVSWNDGGMHAQATVQARATAPAVHASSIGSGTNNHGEHCRYCAGTLPEGRAAMFCPHCGQNLTIQRCPACGTELEIDWKFCITCGRGVATS